MSQVKKRTRRGDEVEWSKRKRLRSSGSKGSATKLRKLPVRPSLQIQSLYYTLTTYVDFKTGGESYLMASYARGSDEGERHTNETMTYKAALNLHLSASSDACKYSNTGTGCIWLIYDAQPTGNKPSPKDIFGYSDSLNSWPTTWMVSREQCHRFVVKRRLTFTLETNGRLASDVPPSNVVWPPCKKSINFHKFAKGLGVRTEWKNKTDGGIGSIKKGALYFVIAPGNGVEGRMFGTIRMYFKSIGNQ
uniref:Capsid protein n=1 Tax=Wheat dwarf India virus TaxID=1174526 RepID=A0A7L9M9B3_9GEMI|nr:coat protein [Wheat dwarf India virus]